MEIEIFELVLNSSTKQLRLATSCPKSPNDHELYISQKQFLQHNFNSDLWFKYFIITDIISCIRTDRHEITEILLKVALNTIHQTISCTVPVYFKQSNFFCKFISNVTHRPVSNTKMFV
jgi:hypothetical protein